MTVREFIAATLQEPLKKFRTVIQDAILEIITEEIEKLHYDISTLSTVFVPNRSRIDILNVIAESWGYNIPKSATLSEQIDIFSHIAYVNKIRGSIWSIEHCKEIYGGDLPDYIHINIPSYNIFRYSVSPYSIDHIYQDAYRNRVGVYELFLRNYNGDIEEFKRFLYDELVASGSKIYLLNNLTADTRSDLLDTSLVNTYNSQTGNSYACRVGKNYITDTDISTLENENRTISTTENIELSLSELQDSPCNTSYSIKAVCTEDDSFTINWGNDIPSGDYTISYYKKSSTSDNWILVYENVSIESSFSLSIDMIKGEVISYTGFKLDRGNIATEWTESDTDMYYEYPDLFIKIIDSEGNFEYHNIEHLKYVDGYLNNNCILSIKDTNTDTVLYTDTINTDISHLRLIISRDNIDREYYHQVLSIGDKVYLELENPNGIYSRQFIKEIDTTDVSLDIIISDDTNIIPYDSKFVYLPTKSGTSELERVTIGPSNLISVEDAIECSADDVMIDIEPVQDLHGYDSPWPAGGGKNLIYKTLKGVNISSDGKITLYDTYDVFCAKVESGKTYTISINGVATRSVDVGYFAEDPVLGSTTYDGNRNLDLQSTFEATYTGFIGLRFNADTANVQLEEGSTVTSYAPYSNICPISGWTEVNVNHSDADMTNPTTITISLGQTVYGGTLDVVNGVLTVDRAMVDLGTLDWNYEPNYNRHGVNFNQIPNIKIPEGTIVPNALCSKYKIVSSSTGWANRYTVTAMAFDATYLRVYNDGTTDATTYKTAMSGVQLVYELATPITYQLIPQEIALLRGDNNTLWADTGDVTLKYLKDINKLLYIRQAIDDSSLKDIRGYQLCIGNNEGEYKYISNLIILEGDYDVSEDSLYIFERVLNIH